MPEQKVAKGAKGFFFFLLGFVLGVPSLVQRSFHYQYVFTFSIQAKVMLWLGLFRMNTILFDVLSCDITGITFQEWREAPFLSLKVLISLSYEGPILSPNFPYLSDWGGFVADRGVGEFYVAIFYWLHNSLLFSGLLWAAGINQQPFVSYAGLQHLTKKKKSQKTLLKKEEGKKKRH